MSYSQKEIEQIEKSKDKISRLELVVALDKTQLILAQHRDNDMPENYTLEEHQYMVVDPIIESIFGNRSLI